jgi:hypothetical protein
MTTFVTFRVYSLNVLRLMIWLFRSSKTFVLEAEITSTVFSFMLILSIFNESFLMNYLFLLALAKSDVDISSTLVSFFFLYFFYLSFFRSFFLFSAFLWS